MNKNKLHFEISERKLLLRIVDILVVIFAVLSISYFTESKYYTKFLISQAWMFVIAFYVLLFGTIFEIYNLRIASFSLKLAKPLLFTALFVFIAFILTPILTPTLPLKRIEILSLLIVILLSISFWRLIYIYFLASKRFSKQIILVCKAKDAARLSKDLKNSDPHINVKKIIDVDKHSQELSELNLHFSEIDVYLEQVFISEIVVADNCKQNCIEIYNKLLEISDSGIPVKQYEDVYEDITHRIPLHLKEKEFTKFFPYTKNNSNKLYVVFTRAFDVTLSIIGLLFLGLIIPLLYLFNFLWNRGPMFYKQERIGKSGKPFEIVKLRSMVVDAEKNGAVFAQKHDTRVTSFGKFLRKTRLDEFPQFINVLKGEMAVIGPRPEREIFEKEIAEKIPLYLTRHAIKPGLTGWAQVNYPYGASIEDSLMKLQYDLYYIKHRSFILDLNIIVKTLSTILHFRGQ